jgi:hypothetical protein
MEAQNFAANVLRNVVSSLNEWEQVQTYFLANPFARQYSASIQSLTSSRLQEVSPMDLLYFSSLTACWPLVIRVRNEQDFVRLLSLKALKQAIVYFDTRFFSYTQRYVNTISKLSDVFFLFLGPEGGISVFFGNTFADLDFISAHTAYPQDLDEKLSLGLRQYWPQQETVVFSPKTPSKEIVVVPTTLRQRLNGGPILASQEYLQSALGKRVQTTPSLFFRPELVLNNVAVQEWFA